MAAVTDTATQTRPRETTDERTKRPRLWNVVLLNDDDHTFEYVIGMVRRLFGHPAEKALHVARKVDSDGRAVLLTTHLEHAELKREQVHAFGPDRAIASCAGAMSAILEPADFGGEDGDSGGDPPDRGSQGPAR
jgi:ATP-dependent Clp protease adaptor protein ClpS